MKRNMSLLFFLTLLSGCSISTTVKPVQQQISKLCIKNNPSLFMEGFLPEIKKQIEQKEIPTQVVDKYEKNNCPQILEYTANWRWDIVMYLYYAELKVYEDNQLLGLAVYDAKWGGARLDKFGTTSGKVEPLINELFKNQIKHSTNQ